MTVMYKTIALKYKYHKKNNKFANIKIIKISSDCALCLLQE